MDRRRSYTCGDCGKQILGFKPYGSLTIYRGATPKSWNEAGIVGEAVHSIGARCRKCRRAWKIEMQRQFRLKGFKGRFKN